MRTYNFPPSKKFSAIQLRQRLKIDTSQDIQQSDVFAESQNTQKSKQERIIQSLLDIYKNNPNKFPIKKDILLHVAEKILQVIWNSFQRYLRYMIQERNISSLNIFNYGSVINLNRAHHNKHINKTVFKKIAGNNILDQIITKDDLNKRSEVPQTGIGFIPHALRSSPRSRTNRSSNNSSSEKYKAPPFTLCSGDNGTLL